MYFFLVCDFKVPSFHETWSTINMVRTWSGQGKKNMVRKRCQTIFEHVPNMVDHVLTMEHCHQFGGDECLVLEQVLVS